MRCSCPCTATPCRGVGRERLNIAKGPSSSEPSPSRRANAEPPPSRTGLVSSSPASADEKFRERFRTADTGTTSATAGSGTGWIARCPRSFPWLHPEDDLAPGGRLFWVKTVLACGLLCGFLLSPRLWLSSRNYPLSPISALLPKVPAPFDWLWFGALLLLLVRIALTRRPRGLILLFVCLAGLLSLWDQSRRQPWFSQYLFLLAAFVFCSAPPGQTGRSNRAGRSSTTPVSSCRPPISRAACKSAM